MRMHQIITLMPTAIIIVLRGNLPASLAAIGAAMEPPISKPSTIFQLLTPTVMKKVKALESVTKNSVRLTEPIVYFGDLPFAISVLVTIGPHPPPPNESRKPPTHASHPMRFTFLLFGCSWKALTRIFNPRKPAYTATTGMIHFPYLSLRNTSNNAPRIAP